FYSSAARSRTIRRWLGNLGLTLADVFSTCRELDMDVGQKIDERWVCSFLHGDLSAMNMILSCERKFYLVDWEMFTNGPVAWDLKKLYPSHPLEVLRLLRQLRMPGELGAEDQMYLALSCELAALRINRKNRIGYL